MHEWKVEIPIPIYEPWKGDWMTRLMAFRTKRVTDNRRDSSWKPPAKVIDREIMKDLYYKWIDECKQAAMNGGGDTSAVNAMTKEEKKDRIKQMAKNSYKRTDAYIMGKTSRFNNATDPQNVSEDDILEELGDDTYKKTSTLTVTDPKADTDYQKYYIGPCLRTKSGLHNRIHFDD